MIRSIVNFNSAIRTAQSLVLAAALCVGMIARTSNLNDTNAKRSGNVTSNLMEAAAAGVATTAFAPNYADRAIAVRHWNKKVLTVHVAPSATDDKTPQEVTEAAAQSIAIWNNKVGETITLKLTTEADADIDITFVTPGTLRGGAIGLTDVRFHCDDQSIGFAGIRVNEKLSKAELVQVVAHEMGHALGIQGHSDDKNDLMYPFAHLPVQITDRDLNTLHLGYSRIAAGAATVTVE